jgi:parallel beta-helix repeat protein/predicted outer membrane repeat protein
MILLFLCRSASAATLTVGVDAATIQGAIDAAADGDVIAVPAGTWAEAIDFGSKSLTVRGDGVGTTILSPATATDAVTMSSGRACKLEDLEIQPYGARGIALERGELHVTSVNIVSAGATTLRGGATWVDGGELVLDDVTITGATAAYGAAIFVTGGGVVSATSSRIESGSAIYGGAIYAEDGASLDFLDVVANGPYATSHGAFAYLDEADFVGDAVDIFDPSGRNTSGVGFYLTDHSSLALSAGSITGAAASGRSGGYEGGAIALTDGSSADLQGVELSDNLAYAGGALSVGDGASALLSGVRFSDNETTAGGGAVSLSGSGGLSCSACVFSRNRATNGGAVLVGTGASFADDAGKYTGNEATGEGGAVSVSGTGAFSADTATFDGNTSADDGGAVAGSGTVDVTDSSFSGNVSQSGDGGAVGVSGDLTVTGSTFTGNEARLGNGGALWVGGSASIEESRFTGNEADESGGAVWAQGGASLRVWEGSFFRNVAGAYAGAIGASIVPTVSVARAYVHGNRAKYGGGVALYGVSTTGALGNNRITDNVASQDGGGVWLHGTAEIEVLNNTFAGNDGARDGGHLYTSTVLSVTNNLFVEAVDGGGAYGTSATTDRYYNLAWGNAGGDWVGWSDPTGTSGNLSADPRFVAYTPDGDETDDVLYLQAGSPAIDAGSPSILDIDGSRSDIGAYGGPDADVADHDGDGFYDNVDCDDADARISPAEAEIAYDGVDQDCDGADLTDVDGDGVDAMIAGGADCDDADPTVKPGATEVWYDGVDQDCSGGSDFDQDGDHHDAAFIDGGDDCDDEDRTVHGGAVEIWYDGVDQDCDGRNDFDRDRDGFISADYGGSDCDDYNAGRYPGNTEIPYDGVDQDCDGTDLIDVDGDGWVAVEAGGADCNDAQATVYPGAWEDPNDGFDTDCDGFSEWDRDGDGWDDVTYGGGDCDDFDADVNPGVEEVWYDGVDQDCDGRDDDQDGDGYPIGEDCDDENPATHPGAYERLDGEDNDCDGYTEYDDRDGDSLSDLQEWLIGCDPEDPDTDGDGWDDGMEFRSGPDHDGDVIPDCVDTDDDNDGIASRLENMTDIDGDGVFDTDVDGDGIPNAWDPDSDGDGILDAEEGTADLDYDGVGDWLDYQGSLVGGGCGTEWAGASLLPMFALALRRRRAAPETR